MDDETKQKISDTVLSILKEADMDVMTEFKVRNQASEILSIDLSKPQPKQFVRGIIQSYLDARASSDLQPHSDDKEADVGDEMKPVNESEQAVEEEEAVEAVEEEEADVDDDKKNGGSKEYDDDGDLIVCRLSEKRRVTIQDFKGKTLVSIREYYNKDGKELPSSKGISLTTEQWSVFKQNAPAIEQAIKKLKSR